MKEYSKTILKIASISNVVTYSVPTICNEKREIERRIINMKDKKVYSKFSLVILVLTISVISIVSVSLASDKMSEVNNSINYSNSQTSMNTENEVIYVLPVEGGKISAKFGKRIHPITKEEKFHTGVDISIEEGTSICSIAEGKVIYADFDTSNGNTVKIEHADGSVSCYKHGSKILVNIGDELQAGDEIMLVGSTGMSTGPHLHIEVINNNGEYVDINSMFE